MWLEILMDYSRLMDSFKESERLQGEVTDLRERVLTVLVEIVR